MSLQTLCVVVMPGLLYLSCCSLQAAERLRLCTEAVGILIPQFVFNRPPLKMERVEVRQCAPHVGETLQLVAWGRDPDADPQLVIDTSDFTIVQMLMVGHTFVIETTGGPRDQVYVIRYERGLATLVLHKVTRGRASISTEQGRLRLGIADSWNDKIEKFEFPTE